MMKHSVSARQGIFSASKRMIQQTLGTPSSRAAGTLLLATLALAGCGQDAQTTPLSTTPVPTVNLTAGAANVTSGGTSTLTWSSTNATSCTASGGWSGTKTTSGSTTTPSLTATTSFTLTCAGAGGTTPAAA